MKIATAGIALAAALLVASPGALAQNKCTAKGMMAGQAFNLTYCEVAYYQSSQGVSIWFSSTPITQEEREFFQLSSSADRFRKGRTNVFLGFCPGGGSATASPKTAKSMELAFKHATVMDLGPQDQWVLEPTSKGMKVERLAGDMKKGGKLTGKISGEIPAKKPPFTWDLEFDLTLPQKAAGAGPGC